MNKLHIYVENVTQSLKVFDYVSIFRLNILTGNFEEITLINEEKVKLIPGKTVYYFYDYTGQTEDWYQIAFYNSISGSYSSKSNQFQSDLSQGKVGYTFKNYSPPPGEWGKILTADDIRFTYLWGNDLTASNGDSLTQEQLESSVDSALSMWEKELNIDIRKRIYKVEPSKELIRAREWSEGVEYTDIEMPYDFDKIQWGNYGFLQLRKKPILSIESAKLYDSIGNQLIDILKWIRIHDVAGQISIFPKGNFSLGAGYMGSSVFAAWNNMFGVNYPHAFKIEYTTGFENSDYVDNSLREVIGMAAAIIVLAYVGDGLLAGFSSSSLSLDGLSESFSSTQSATSAYFGARIKDYMDRMKQFRQTNKLKYGNAIIGFIGG